MTPLDLIKEGFIQQDWSMIADAYRTLTGTELESPADIEVPTPTQKKRGRPRKANRASVADPPTIHKSRPVKHSDSVTPEEFYAKRRGKTTLDLVDERPNWFETTGYQSVKDKSDPIFQKKVYKSKRALPKPPSVEKKKYVCRKCGHTDLLYPSQVVVGQFSSKGYYCNSCCGGY